MNLFDDESTRALINKVFSSFPLKEQQNKRFNEVKSYAREFAESINDYVPSCREKSLALTKLEEAVMWVKAAISRHE